MARANAVMQYGYDAESGEMRWVFGGKIADVVYTIGDNVELNGLAAIHGFKQKIGDAAALGMTATPEEKADAMRVVVAALESGQWNAPRGESEVGSMLARAIAEVSGKPIEAIREFLKGKSKEERDALAAIKKYADVIAGYRAAKVANVPTEGLLAGLDAI